MGSKGTYAREAPAPRGGRRPYSAVRGAGRVWGVLLVAGGWVGGCHPCEGTCRAAVRSTARYGVRAAAPPVLGWGHQTGEMTWRCKTRTSRLKYRDVFTVRPRFDRDLLREVGVDEQVHEWGQRAHTHVQSRHQSRGSGGGGGGSGGIEILLPAELGGGGKASTIPPTSSSSVAGELASRLAAGGSSGLGKITEGGAHDKHEDMQALKVGRHAVEVHVPGETPRERGSRVVAPLPGFLVGGR